jgi:hypothetical protein
MGLLMTKPWRPLTEVEVSRVGGWTGVYELGDADGTVLYVGVAGGRSLFGLKSELQRHLRSPAARQFRVEVNAQYTTRWKELLMAHVATSGDVPVLNRDEALPTLGRLSL